MKTGVLCSHPFAFPSIQILNQTGNLVGLGAPEKGGFTHQLNMMANHAFVPMAVIADDDGESIQTWLETVRPDVVFIMGFPFKIQERFLSVPPKGFYNFHTGLLPDYRGIDPVFWQIRNGERFGGVSVQQMDGGFDSGPVAHVEQIEILPYETYGLQMQRLGELAGKATSKMIEKLSNGGPELQDQKDPEKNFLHRPSGEDLLIRWESSGARAVRQLVQASNPSYGGAMTFYKGMLFRVIQAGIHRRQTPPGTSAGTVISVEDGVYVLCGDGKSVRLEIVFTEAGLFTGDKLVHVFDIQEGDVFSDKQFADIAG